MSDEQIQLNLEHDYELAFFTMKEGAKILRMSVQCLTDRCIAGDIPSIKVGRKRIIPKKALMEWIEKRQYSAKR